MKEVLKIDRDTLVDELFQQSFEVDDSSSSSSIVIEPDQLGDLVTEIKEKLLSEGSDSVERGFYCETCGELYEQDNGKDQCDDCIE